MPKAPTTRGERTLLLTALAIFYFLLGMILVQDDEVGGTTPPELRGWGDISGKSGTLTPAMPTGVVSGDLLVAVIETANETDTTIAGYTALTCGPSENGTSCPASCTAAAALWRIADGTGDDIVVTNDSGNHQIGMVLAVKTGTFDTVTPIGKCINNKHLGSAISITGVTTTIDNSMLFAISAGSLPDKNGSNLFSGEANANWDATPAETDDESSNVANGGALVVYVGTMATAGASGTTTSTATSNATRANITFSINPVP